MSEENTQKNNSSTGETSIPELEKFIFRPDIFEAAVVPRKLFPAKVAEFLQEKVTAEATLKNFIQIEKVAVFYETFEVAGKFRGFLNKKEAGVEDVQRSTVIARIIAKIGEKEDVAFARDYYKYLVERADSKEEFEDLILLYDALGAGADVNVLRQKIKTKSTALETKKESDEAVRVLYLELVGTVTNKLNRAEKAQFVKSKILDISDRKKRIEAEIKAYLTIEYGYTEFLENWAAARLRRETWAIQPDEQTKRTDNSQLKTDVSKLLTDFLKKLDDVPNLDLEEKEFAKIRTLRAVKFFNGKVSESDENFLKQHKNQQMDILANEGFMLDK